MTLKKLVKATGHCGVASLGGEDSVRDGVDPPYSPYGDMEAQRRSWQDVTQ